MRAFMFAVRYVYTAPLLMELGFLRVHVRLLSGRLDIWTTELNNLFISGGSALYPYEL